MTILVWLTAIALGGTGLGHAAENVPGRAEPFKPTWESLKRYQCPEWFRDAKFGIYAHWGPYSVPQYRTEWYSHYMYQPGHDCHKHHVKIFGPVSTFGYKDLIPKFTAAKFDADEWAELYRRAGARFAGPVAEHADGFAMWDSALTKWDAKDMGPRRDVVGELIAAIRKRGMKVVTTLHHQWQWGWYATEIADADVRDPQYADLYGPVLPTSAFSFKNPVPPPSAEFSQRWLEKVKEVVRKYHPDLLWFDNKMHNLDETYRLQMAAYYYNHAAGRGQEVVMTYKLEDFKPGTAVLDIERGRMSEIHPAPWLTDTSVASNSWCYTTDLTYYSASRLVHDLVDIVSKNGCLLLNVAPRADGVIPPEQRQRLLEMGRWLEINGEAIYGTRPWRTHGEGPTQVTSGHFGDLKLKGFTPQDIRFTRSKDGRALYAIALGWPEDGTLTVRSLAGDKDVVENVQLLGHKGKLAWTQTDKGLVVTLPDKAPCAHAVVLRITGEID